MHFENCLKKTTIRNQNHFNYEKKIFLKKIKFGLKKCKFKKIPFNIEENIITGITPTKAINVVLKATDSPSVTPAIA